MERGLLIAFEGVDKSGKQTQVEELAKRFLLDGQEVVTIDFPSYDTPTGKAIEAILGGYHPLDLKNNPLEFQALMTINRYEQQRRIETALMQNKVVICDRYLFSGMIYGINDGLDSQWLYDIQHSLVQPDIVVLLDIGEAEYKRRCGNYAQLDKYESNLPLILSAMKLYREFAEMNEWIMLDGEQTVEDLAQSVYHNVKIQMKDMEE